MTTLVSGNATRLIIARECFQLSSSAICSNIRQNTRITHGPATKKRFNIQKLDELSDDNKKVPRDEQGNFVLTSRG
jgi:hypothetical protein